MTLISIFGKYLDQPALVSKLSKAMPATLIAGAAGYGLHIVYKQKDDETKEKTFVKNLCVLGFTVASALVATRGLKIGKKQIFEGLIEIPHLHKHDIEKALQEAGDNKYLTGLINKVKDGKVLKFSEVKALEEKQLADKVIPPPHSHSPFGEIRRLSLLGLIPVAGGITGGILGDKLTEKDWKERIPNKIKEGTYQYLANIFLCNVGAGAALIITDKMKVKSKVAKAGAMVAGILLTGVVGGSAIANYIGKKCINPLFGKRSGREGNMCAERTPEVLDIGLHVDDVSTVAVMSGLKWIEPVLPILYSISGYRAGIGYRNFKNSHFKEKKRENHHRNKINKNPKFFGQNVWCV